MKYTFYIVSLLAASLLLGACSAGGGRMRQQLSELEELNRSGGLLLNDTLAERLVEYFDRHGSANERMRARYMLGRTYFDLGELPRALETFFTARDCADTAAADCDYRTLSKIHSQSARVFAKQALVDSRQKESKLAISCAERARDTIMVLNCLALQAEVFNFKQEYDSVISMIGKVRSGFLKLNRPDRASQVIGVQIYPQIKTGKLADAKKSIDEYERFSGFFDDEGNIKAGMEVYYHVKGYYYLGVNRLDSAEYLFRKELRDGKKLNNQIAGCKGLQDVYTRAGIPDSIAKYATLSYELNDSAYLASEQENILRLTASYDYAHHKYVAMQRQYEAKLAWLVLALVCSIVVILLVYFSRKYVQLKKFAVDFRLRNAEITRRLHGYAKSNNVIYPSLDDWRLLRSLVDREVPRFKEIIRNGNYQPTDFEYEICLMVRVGIAPTEMSRLAHCSGSTITKTRRKLLLKIFMKEGTAEDFDDEIGKIL